MVTQAQESLITALMQSNEDNTADTLMQNPQMNFVQRIIHPESYPAMDWANEQKATHQMAWSESDGRYFVYPKIIQDDKTKELKELSDDAAWDYAVKNNELIEMPSAEAADRFSKDYKQFWDDK